MAQKSSAKKLACDRVRRKLQGHSLLFCETLAVASPAVFESENESFEKSKSVRLTQLRCVIVRVHQPRERSLSILFCNVSRSAASGEFGRSTAAEKFILGKNDLDDNREYPRGFWAKQDTKTELNFPANLENLRS